MLFNHCRHFQGCHVFYKLRPVDQLRHILEITSDPECEMIEAFFRIYKVSDKSRRKLCFVWVSSLADRTCLESVFLSSLPSRPCVSPPLQAALNENRLPTEKFQNFCLSVALGIRATSLAKSLCCVIQNWLHIRPFYLLKLNTNLASSSRDTASALIRHGGDAIMEMWVAEGPVPSPRGGYLVGLAPPDKAPSPPNWNIKHYK